MLTSSHDFLCHCVTIERVELGAGGKPASFQHWIWTVRKTFAENRNLTFLADDTAEPITEAHQEIVNSLQLLEVVIPTLNPKLLGQVSFGPVFDRFNIVL